MQKARTHVNGACIDLKTHSQEMDIIFYYNLKRNSVWGACDVLNFCVGESDIDVLYFVIPYDGICISVGEEHIDDECSYPFLVINFSVWAYEKMRLGYE